MAEKITEFTENEAALKSVLRKKLDEVNYMGTMLALIVNQKDPDGNCKKMYEFLQEHSDATHEEIYDKTDEILGIE